MLLLKMLFKLMLSGSCWVFVLSIPYQGVPLFWHAEDLIVRNKLVQALDYQLGVLWERSEKVWDQALKEISGPKNHKSL
tara:strand:- start:634 stop:870 length:237 start_codon:yes stop_codon:yes gene_type:complete